MNKKLRIRLLEDLVAGLEERLKTLSERVNAFEARSIQPRYMPAIGLGTPWYRLPDDNTTWPRCTCGTTAICPVHGPMTSQGTGG